MKIELLSVKLIDRLLIKEQENKLAKDEITKLIKKLDNYDYKIDQEKDYR